MTNTSKLSILVLALLAAGCGEAVAPSSDLHAPSFATVAGGSSGVTLDQLEAAVNIGVGWTNGGTHVGKEFDQNPHTGDAIVATFVWRGTANTITDVTDHLEDGTPVGNTYTLVDYTTANGWSVATYVATSVQGFTYPSPSPDKNLAVHAIFSDQISEGSEMISAYRGVGPVLAQALGAHSAASGTGSSTTLADPGPIAVADGAVAYTFTMADQVADLTNPAGSDWLTGAWDTTLKIAGAYALPPAGTFDPQWTWSFQSPSNWFAQVLALNPQVATRLAFKVQPSNTLLPGQTIAPPVQVTVLDDQGNVVTGFSGTVTAALGHDGSLFHNAKLSGTLTVNVANGIATFTDLSVDQIGMGYTLMASAPGLTGAASSAFSVTLP